MRPARYRTAIRSSLATITEKKCLKWDIQLTNGKKEKKEKSKKEQN
jgi:hypothetical protein